MLHLTTLKGLGHNNDGTSTVLKIEVPQLRTQQHHLQKLLQLPFVLKDHTTYARK